MNDVEMHKGQIDEQKFIFIIYKLETYVNRNISGEDRKDELNL